MDVSVLIVTYNSRDCIGACVAALRGQTGVAFEIVIVDNASDTPTRAALRALPDEVRLVLNKRNVGFGAGNNTGLPHCTGRYVYMLNPDALVQPGAVAALVAYMDAHPRVGLAGTVLRRGPGAAPVGPRYGYLGGAGPEQQFAGLPGKIAWVTGASMIARRAVLEQVGGFDPRFFLYAEEIDLALRIRQAGHEIGYCEAAEVVHAGGHSQPDANAYDLQLQKQRGALVFCAKHYPATVARRIARSVRRRAMLNVLLLSLRSLLRTGDGALRTKIARERGIRDAAREFLKAR